MSSPCVSSCGCVMDVCGVLLVCVCWGRGERWDGVGSVCIGCLCSDWVGHCVFRRTYETTILFSCPSFHRHAHTYLHVEPQDGASVCLVQALERAFKLRPAGLAEAVWTVSLRDEG
jgi:hypothetical protein